MKLLVVDDEQDVRDLFLQRFRKEIRKGDMKFVFALSGTEALHKLKALNEESVLVLSDINMPGMSGLELLAHIKNDLSPPSPPVMLITAYGDDENYKAAMDKGADDFFTKPLDFSLLKRKLKNLV